MFIMFTSEIQARFTKFGSLFSDGVVPKTLQRSVRKPSKTPQPPLRLPDLEGSKSRNGWEGNVISHSFVTGCLIGMLIVGL